MKIRLPFRLLTLLLAATSLAFLFAAPNQAHARQDRGKFGSGALLKKLFGNDRSDSEDKAKAEKAAALAKEIAEKEKNLAQRSREKLEATRLQMQRDAERVQQKLKQTFGGSIGDAPRTSDDSTDPEQNKTISNVPIIKAGPGMSSVLESNKRPYPVRNASSPKVPNNMGQVTPSPLSVGPRNQPRVRPEATATPAGTSEVDPNSRTFGILADQQHNGKGIRVQQVAANSLAQSIGIKPGDVLQSIAGLDLSEVSEIDGITKVLQDDDQFEIYFTRNGKTVSKVMSLDGQIAPATEPNQPANASVVDFPGTPTTSLSDETPLYPTANRQPDRNASPTTPADLRVQQLEQTLKSQQAIIRRLEQQIDQLKSNRNINVESAPPTLNLETPLPELELDLDLTSPN